MSDTILVNGHRQRRNITISRRRTSLSLEESIWASLSDICTRENMSLAALVYRIDERRVSGSLASALRVYVLAYFQTLFEGNSDPSVSIFEKALERFSAKPHLRQTPVRYPPAHASYAEERRS